LFADSASILFGAFFTLAVAWMLGNICLRRLPVPWTIALAVGAAAESTIVFLLLVCGMGNRGQLHLVGRGFAWRRSGGWGAAGRGWRIPLRRGRIGSSVYLAGAALAFYGALYLINALAPELEPDARMYHLGLTSEYVRLGGFPSRVGFYEMLPQGFEMLFVPAFAFGRHSAARLVHCAFLLATVPLMLRIGRRLGCRRERRAGRGGAVLLRAGCGITGTSAYTDAGGVFFTLATFYALLVWRDTRDARYLAVAGITAGFCYAIKFPGGLVAILAAVVRGGGGARHTRPAVGGADRHGAGWWRRPGYCGTSSSPAIRWRRCSTSCSPTLFPCVDGAGTGGGDELVVGSAALAGSIRTGGGRDIWRHDGSGVFRAAAGITGAAEAGGPMVLDGGIALLALPWLWNTGARFLMPALPFLAMALALGVAIALPRQALWACVAVQAVGCWPQIFKLYHPAYTWRLERIPWRAALRIQPEQEYLSRVLPAYQVARLLQDDTKPGEKIFSLISVPEAYTDREVLEFWHSAQADQLLDTLRVAVKPNETLFDVSANWSAQPLSGLRIRVPQASPVEWQIHEIKLYSGDRQVRGGPQWELQAWPNVGNCRWPSMATRRRDGARGNRSAQACTWRRISTERRR
jgi:hypothetical protein